MNSPGVLYLTKIATQLVQPLSLALLCAAIGLALAWRGRTRLGVALAAAALAALWLAATPLVASRILYSLESQWPAAAAEDAPSADAIVVLGTAVARRGPTRPRVELDDSSDRLLHAARLHRAGKAPWVIASGGAIPWARESGPESAEMALLLEEWGVPRDAILLESRSRTTWENALRVKELLDARGLGAVLLVTSAAHMPRALAMFERAGIRVLPAPTDFGGEPAPPGRLGSWLPSASVLDAATRAAKEYLGILVYAVRARIAGV